MSLKKHEQGFELYKKHNGKISNAEIAKCLNASEATVRKWKSRYKWNEKLGIKKSVTKSKKASVTKNIRDEQQKRIVDALIEAGTYSPALDLLIDIYLDAYEEYHKLKSQGIAEEKHRKEIARLLGQLGLDGKNKDLIKSSDVLLEKQKEKENKPEEEVPKNNKLLMFRQRMSK